MHSAAEGHAASIIPDAGNGTRPRFFLRAHDVERFSASRVRLVDRRKRQCVLRAIN